MKVAISQPTYLPWAGYFDLVDQVDVFIFLDHVQFEKRSWQQRNRIKGPNGLILLTVPVMVKGRFEQTLAEAAISEPQEWQKHRRAIETNYHRAPYFEQYWPEFCSVLEAGWNGANLSNLNMTLIRWFMQQFNIDKRILQSSELPCTGRRSELLVNICEHMHADHYISAIGSAEYLLEDEQQFAAKRINVQFQHYEHPKYEQLFPPFVPFASAIDLLFNVGTRAMEVLRSGRRAPFSVAEVRHLRTEKIGVAL
jgi:hypothetical protein